MFEPAWYLFALDLAGLALFIFGWAVVCLVRRKQTLVRAARRRP